MQKPKQKGPVQLAFAMILVGSAFVVAKILTTSVPLFLANSLRFTAAAIVLLPVLIQKMPEIKQVKGPDMKRLLLSAVFGVFLFNILLFWGLRYVTAGTSGIIASLTPVAIAAASTLFLKEAMSRTKTAASIMATAGLVVINLCSGTAENAVSFSMLGSVLILGVVLCDTAFTLLAKSVTGRVSPQVMTLIVVYSSCLLFLPLGIWQALHFNFSSLDAEDWLLILYLGTVVNALAYLLWYSGLKRVSANQAAVFTGIMPISSLVLAAIFLKEPVVPLQGFGLVLVLVGVLIVAQTRTSPVKREEEFS